MKAPVVIVVATLTAGILVVGSLLIATGARGEDAVRVACADLPGSLSPTGPFTSKTTKAIDRSSRKRRETSAAATAA